MAGAGGAATGEVARRRAGRAAAALALAAVFLLLASRRFHHWDEAYYLFSVAHHTPRELLTLEPGLREIPDGYFSAKVGFVFLLRALVLASGSGLAALAGLEVAFTLLLLGAAAAGYGLLRELLGAERSPPAAAAFLLSPIPLYLGYKVLSEGPSLLLVTLGGWAFARGLRDPGDAPRRQRIALGAAAALGFAAGTFCRLPAAVFPAGLALGLLAAGAAPRARVLRHTAAVGAATLALLAAVYAGAHLPVHLLGGAIASLAAKPAAAKLAAPVLALQLFLPFLLLGLLPPWDREARLLAVWTAVAALPFAGGHEPRYYAYAALPAAALAARGIGRAAARLAPRRPAAAWAALLAAVVLADRLLFAGVMPYEIDQRSYGRILASLSRRQPGATLLVPWLSDYAFLGFAYAGHPVRLAIDPQNRFGAEIAQSAALRSWLGEGAEVAALPSLAALPRPWIYLGWGYNPAWVTLRDRFHLAGLGLPASGKRMLDHFDLAWVWHDPRLRLTPVAADGQYRAFEVRPAPPDPADPLRAAGTRSAG